VVSAAPAALASPTGAAARPAAVAKHSHVQHRPYFVGNFDTCDFSQWHEQGPTQAFRISTNPVIEGRCAAVITVGPDAAGGLVNTQSDGAALWLQPESYGRSGATVWQHFSVMFLPGFKPTAGEWNWFAEWHNDQGFQQFVGKQITWEMPNLCWSIVDRGHGPRVAMRIMGGASVSPVTRWIYGPRLRTGHWYDFLVHARWSPDPHAGAVAWWLDGRKLYDAAAPTLYTRPDGSTSSVYFVEDYYRLHATWDASVAFDGTRIGPSRVSVAYRTR
jgi:hypothetical protein